MKEYTAKEMKLLKANPYTFKITKSKLYFTIEFKEAFWNAYQAGNAPRKIIEDLGYDLEMFGQKQIEEIILSVIVVPMMIVVAVVFVVKKILNFFFYLIYVKKSLPLK